MALKTSTSESWRVFFPMDSTRTKINNAFSRYSDIIHGVPQGSILGPLLIYIYICEIFFDIIKCDMVSYADDNTPYSFDCSLDNVISNLEKSTISYESQHR